MGGYAHRRTRTGQPTRSNTYKFGAGSSGFNRVPGQECYSRFISLRAWFTKRYIPGAGWVKVWTLDNEGEEKKLKAAVLALRKLTRRQRDAMRARFTTGLFEEVNGLLTQYGYPDRLRAPRRRTR